MPTYTYRCTACGYGFERFQRFSDGPLTECPECQGLVKRVLHPVGIVFKGSGWYITDSRSATPSENGRAETSEKSDNKDGKSTEKTAKAETSEKSKTKAAAAADS
jgi:putative FmdB family regulatory protein